MAKRQRTVSLSFVLLRFAAVMIGCMLFCWFMWTFCVVRLQNNSVIYPGYISNQQAEKMLAGEPQTFVSPGRDFLAEYALFGTDGKVMESNTKGKTLEILTGLLKKDGGDVHVLRHTYADGSTVIIRWNYRKEFASPVLRDMLPPFEYLWWALLGVLCVLCLVMNTLWLRRCLASRLKLFSEVSEKVGAQELDFVIPHAGIREYDQALGAMEDMREALYSSLASQWAAQQEREAEIAALAHDLKTPLTLVGGNAELLLDEELPESCRKSVEKIAAANERAKLYVASLLETSAGAEEAFERTSLSAMLDELYENTIAIAEDKGVRLQVKNGLNGSAVIQKNHLLRAFGNVVLNAIEHTPSGGCVYVEGSKTEEGWQITVSDEGPGFSKAALHHAAERLWRDDAARSADGHNGIGLWFAAEAVKKHAGRLELGSCSSGGRVTMKFFQEVRDN